MLENINLALQGVWSHKLRSFLTMLGIIIGIAAIITIVSIDDYPTTSGNSWGDGNRNVSY